MGRKTFDTAFLTNAVRDVVNERRLEKLREEDPALARYYDTALEDFLGQLAAPKASAFWRGRLARSRGAGGRRRRRHWRRWRSSLARCGRQAVAFARDV